MSSTQRLAAAQDVYEKTTGRAVYARDLLHRGSVLAGLVRSALPHARILSIDTSAALAVPGVLAVLTGADFAGFRLGHLIADQAVLAEDRVRYVGEPVAAVAATDFEALRAGVRAVRALYEPLPAALTPEQALRLEVPIHDDRPDNVTSTLAVDRGDWEQVVGLVDVWAEGEFSVQPAQHAYMEPYAALAVYRGDRIILHAPVHAPHALIEEYLPVTGKWEERFEIRTPYIGGSFGAKYEHPIHLICGEFARRLRRDVGIVFSRREDFLQATPRVGMQLRVRIGATAEGGLLAKESEVLADNGAYSLHSPAVYGAASVRMDNLYRYQAVRARSRLVYTNMLPSQCFRGFGNPQAAFAQEQLVDEIARKLNLSPVEVRRRSAVREGDTSIHGWRIGTCGLGSCLDRVDEAIQADRSAPAVSEAVTAASARREAPARPSQGAPDERFAVGYGIACGTHVVSNRSANPSGDYGLVRLAVDGHGRVSVYCGEVEVGAGTVRTLMNVAAQSLGINLHNVLVVLGDTDRTPHGLGSFASRTAFFAGNAMIDAAERLKSQSERLCRELEMAPRASLAEVAGAAAAAGRLGELAVEGKYVPSGVEVTDSTWKGNVSPTYTFSAHGCNVRVDTWTGQVEVLRYWAAHDAGSVLNRVGALGQVYGGVLQGLGYALSEGVVCAPDGRILNAGFLDYRIPTFADAVPTEVFFADTYEEAGPLGGKSIAEPPINPVAACVANAIHDATGWRVRHLPMEAETVYRAGHPDGLVSDGVSSGPAARLIVGTERQSQERREHR